MSSRKRSRWDDDEEIQKHRAGVANIHTHKSIKKEEGGDANIRQSRFTVVEPEESSKIRKKGNSEGNVKVRQSRFKAATEQETLVDSSKIVWGKGNSGYDSQKPKDKEEVEATSTAEEKEEAKVEKEKANFGLSGALSKDKVTGNIFNGVQMKWSEPLEAATPPANIQWRLYVFKKETLLETLYIYRQSAFLFGRDERCCDIIMNHPSCSMQHAVIQYRRVAVNNNTVEIEKEVKPYLLDLQSKNKTFLNGIEIDNSRYYELREGDSITFGGSTREYVLLHQNSNTNSQSRK